MVRVQGGEAILVADLNDSAAGINVTERIELTVAVVYSSVEVGPVRCAAEWSGRGVDGRTVLDRELSIAPLAAMAGFFDNRFR